MVSFEVVLRIVLLRFVLYFVTPPPPRTEVIIKKPLQSRNPARDTSLVNVVSEFTYSLAGQRQISVFGSRDPKSWSQIIYVKIQ